MVIDAQGVLIDGRNRLAACEIAKVEPTYQALNGHDPVAYIWGANVKRRQMTKGQVAMVAAAEFFLAAKKGGADQGKSKAAKAAGISPASLTLALTVKEYAPDLTGSVIAGTMTLDAAYEHARQRKQEADWRDNGLATLRKVAPDLAAQVAWAKRATSRL